jgi:hypothetical protein
MKLEHGTFCPLIKDKCKQLDCAFFLQVRGSHPQTGAPVDEWDCAIKWLPVLMIENTNTARGTQAATESMRNEIVERMDNPPHHVPGQLDLIDRIASTPLLTNGDRQHG